MELGRGDERVNAGPRRAFERLARLLDVLRAAPRQRGDDRSADVRRDARHGLGVGLGSDRKAGLDDVHAERVERARHAQLLVHVHREAGACSPSRSVVSKMIRRSPIRLVLRPAAAQSNLYFLRNI